LGAVSQKAHALAKLVADVLQNLSPAQIINPTLPQRLSMSMAALGGYVIPATVGGLLVLAIALIILWIVVSIPVYVGGKLVTEGRGGFGDAMAATLGGAIVYILVLYGGTFFLSAIISPDTALVLSFVLALVAWVAVYAAAFDTSWLRGAGIAIVSWAVLVVVDFVLINAFGVAIPKFYPF
jgi:hypothetical protein